MAFPRILARRIVLLALVLAGWPALAQTDPPTRAGSVSAIVGTLALAPAGVTEWADAPRNRPVTAGDRLWTDTAARAEVQLGTAVLRLDSETFLTVQLLDEALLHATMREGAVLARVRALAAGELFQIDTPELAFRAVQPGTYRIDADARRHLTRVTVRNGLATVSGRSGRTLTLYPGQQLQVAGSDLEQVASVSFADDAFDGWATGRDAREARSTAARHVPALVGAPQLDGAGTWTDDPAYGLVWYPRTVAADWAPYRYGRWQWIQPWGWTWIDDAPWGFAPFHYGRWAMIDGRWGWVPGRAAARPVYAPALVAFVDGGSIGSLPLGSGDTIAWYPLAPGEPWRPFFAATAGFLRRANESQGSGALRPEHRIEDVTAVRIEQFRSGEPVQRHWRRSRSADVSRAQPLGVPSTARGFGPAAASPAAPAESGHPRAVRASTQASRREVVQEKGPRREPRPSSGRQDGLGRHSRHIQLTDSGNARVTAADLSSSGGR